MEQQLIEFIEETAKALGRIEASEEVACRERAEMRSNCRTCLDKIPRIELGLNNHLATHDKIQTWFARIFAGLATTGILYLLKVIFHVKIF